LDGIKDGSEEGCEYDELDKQIAFVKPVVRIYIFRKPGLLGIIVVDNTCVRG
jgi:hypothetical protein